MIRATPTLAILLGLSTATEFVISSDGGSLPSAQTSFLERARNLTAPIASGTQNSAYEHASFWDENGSVLRQAWQEWEDQMTLNVLHEDHKEWISPSLSKSITKTFANPSIPNEDIVKSLWSNTYKDANNEMQSLPQGVYSTTLLTPEGISMLRLLLHQSSQSGIPARRPNDMNRNGYILDRKVNGALPVTPLLDFVEHIIDAIARPVGRMLFEEYIGCGDDIEYFAFTIRYDGNEESNEGSAIPRDVELNEHRDASVITMNINLNLEEETYSGSDVYFREFPYSNTNTEETANTTSFVKFTPGMAILHLGAHRHGSLPIYSTNSNSHDNTSGTRYNLVIWLFGKDGDVRIAPYSSEERMNVIERWHGCESVGGVSNLFNLFA